MPLLLSLSPTGPLMKAGIPHRDGSSLVRPLADLTCPELAYICTHTPVQLSLQNDSTGHPHKHAEMESAWPHEQHW